MISWNFSRFKIFFLGLLGLGMVYTIGPPLIQVIHSFTQFEQIVLCFLLVFLIFTSMFLLLYGLEPVMPVLKFGRDQQERPVITAELWKE
jgi:hypothetical protein